MRFSQQPIVGAGIGLRSQHYAYILEQRPKVAWFEAITENYMQDKALPLSYLLQIREHYPLTLHGVNLSIGSYDPINDDYLKQLKNLIHIVEPSWVSDHLCWTSINGRYLGDLLPLPHHQQVIKHVVERILRVQDFLGQRILLENISRYVEFSDSTISEADFLREVVLQADCDILLDINNLYVNAHNHQFCAQAYLGSLPVNRVKQFHLAGHEIKTTHLLDTHAEVICDGVWALFAKALSLFGLLPSLIEWDNDIPEFATLYAESQKAERYYGSQKNSAGFC